MTKRGPKPQSEAVKIAKGNPGRRPIGKTPKVSTGKSKDIDQSIKPPLFLKGEGLKVWKRLAPQLFGIKILTQIDRETFGRYCRNFGRWIDLQKAIDKDGSYYSTDTGFARPHPAMIIVLRLEPILERSEDRFGLNPSERQRLFAARAAGAPSDLFSQSDDRKQVERSSLKSSEPKLDHVSPIGMLN